jgi:hypothetical protein
LEHGGVSGLRATIDGDMKVHRTPAAVAVIGTRRRSPSRRRVSASPLRLGIQSIVLGVVALMVVAGWPMSVGTTVVFGVAVVLWAIGNFAVERPDELDADR